MEPPDLPRRRRVGTQRSATTTPAVSLTAVLLAVVLLATDPLAVGLRVGAAPDPAPLAATLVEARSPAQDAPEARTPPAADSAELEDDLRDAQRDFERFRRRRLPPTGRGGGGRCDERVGRYCLTHDDGEREPRPEAGSIADRREELIVRLSRAAERLPGSGWLAGQRVWYLVEAGRPGEALAAARACRAERSWCEALAGLALHEAERHVASEEAFRRALAALPPERRRGWTTPELLLEGDARDRWEDAAEGERRELEQRLWWLADPLWLLPGSDRWIEHLARHVAVRVHREAASPFGSYWHDELEELVVRYGWPAWWERYWPRPYRAARSGEPVVGHHGPDALRYLPPPEVLADPWSADGTWDLDPDEPRSSYQPTYLDTLHLPRAHRLARFDRLDSTLVVATWRTGWEGDGSAEALLRADEGPGRVLGSTRGPVPAAAGRLLVALPRGPAVLSLEVLDREGRRAARVRRGLPAAERPEGVAGISDLLPVAPGTLPADLREAAARARLPGDAVPGERIGLYWELYGPARLFEGARLDLALERRGGGLLRRLAEGLGLADDGARRVAAGWRFAAEPGRRVHPSRIVLTLPEELDEGEYRLAAEVRLRGREPLRAVLPLELRER